MIPEFIPMDLLLEILTWSQEAISQALDGILLVTFSPCLSVSSLTSTSAALGKMYMLQTGGMNSTVTYRHGEAVQGAGGRGAAGGMRQERVWRFRAKNSKRPRPTHSLADTDGESAAL